MLHIIFSTFRRSLMTVFAVACVSIVLFSPSAFAADTPVPTKDQPNATVNDGGNTNGNACGVQTIILGCSGAGDNPIIKVFMEIFNFFAVGIGILTVGGIIFGGIKYTTANGNSSQAEQGITTIVNAVIGLLLFMFMFALLNWLVPGGLFR